MSRRVEDAIVPTGQWVRGGLGHVAEGMIDTVLEGRGDRTRERTFRMNVTLCRHRALSEAEFAALPPEWHACPARDIAGGPVEILHATPAMPNGPSVHPCESPGRHVIEQLGNPELWIPIDCGRCAPCEARAAR